MSLSINNNITALNAWRNLKMTDGRMTNSMEKLSSGLRINRAADDPAGLVISEKMRAQLSGLGAAAKNTEKAINLISTAEAALSEISTPDSSTVDPPYACRPVPLEPNAVLSDSSA